MSQRISLACRLAAMFALTAAVVFAGVAFFLYCVLADSVRGQIRDELTFQHALLDTHVKAADTPVLWAALTRKLDAMSPDGGRIEYAIDSPDPAWRYGNSRAFDRALGPHDDITHFLSDDTPLASTRCAMAKRLDAQGTRPELRFIIALDCTSYLRTKESFTTVLTVSAALGILLVALLGFHVAKLGLRPVRNLSQQANALPPNDPTQRLELRRLPPEIHELALSFNNALARREAAWRQLEAFNADVAHELRTPLTNLIGETQVVLAHPRPVQELEETLASNLEELERMSAIVNDMLFLSSAENGHRAADLSEVSLRTESEKTIEYLEANFLERDMTVSLLGDAQATVDRRLFHRALANLLANSASYAREGSNVEVSITRRGNETVIAVSDHGEPIAQDQQSRLFERFVRIDEARTQCGVHHGLGLAIVRAIALMHGGDTFVHSEDGRNTFGFTLQARPARTA